jgi:hypothetical protein
MKLNAQQEKFIAQFHSDRFIEELREHCEDQQPGFTEAIGPERLDGVLRAIVANAKAIGYNMRGAIWHYMDMVWQLGWNFEDDPQYPWVPETRARLNSASPFDQAEDLRLQTQEWREATWGQQGQHRLVALERLLQTPLLELPVRESRFEPDMLACLKNLYRVRCEVVGDEALRVLIQRSQESAREHFHLQSAAHRALVVLIAFTLGHAFMRHPLHDWAVPEDGLVTHDTSRHQETAQRLAEGFRQTLLDERFDLMEGRFVLHPVHENKL